MRALLKGPEDKGSREIIIPKWTSCETDLPERGALCMLLYSNGKISGGEYLGGRAWDVDFPDQVLDTKVIAWMKAPQDMDVLVW